jgi:hypothetical protein
MARSYTNMVKRKVKQMSWRRMSTVIKGWWVISAKIIDELMICIYIIYV